MELNINTGSVVEDLTNNLNNFNINSNEEDKSMDIDLNTSFISSTSYMDLTTMNISYPVLVPTQSSMKQLKIYNILPHITNVDFNLPHYNMITLLGQFLLFDYNIDVMAMFLKLHDYNNIDCYELAKFFYQWCEINL